MVPFYFSFLRCWWSSPGGRWNQSPSWRQPRRCTCFSLVSFVGVCLEIASLSESSSSFVCWCRLVPSHIFFFLANFFVHLHHRLSTPLNPSRAIPRRFFFSGSLGYFRFILKERFVGWAPLFYLFIYLFFFFQNRKRWMPVRIPRVCLKDKVKRVWLTFTQSTPGANQCRVSHTNKIAWAFFSVQLSLCVCVSQVRNISVLLPL